MSIKLTERLMACDQFTLRPGMDLLQPWLRRVHGVRKPHPGELINLSDPATQGCLLAMLREADGVTRVETWHHETGAAARFDEDDIAPDEEMSWIHAPDLGEAIARALVAKWADE